MPASSTRRADISPSNSGQVAIAFGHHLIRINSSQTGGPVGVLEATLPAGEGPPLHVHEREEETIIVLSGRFGFWCGEDHVELEEGGCIVFPRGIPHRFQNVGPGEGKIRVIVTPGGFENFFPTVESRKPRDFAEIAVIAAEFGLTFLPAAG